MCPEPKWKHKDLIDIVINIKPTVLVGAAGHIWSFTKEVIEKMVEVNSEGGDTEDPSHRPVIFALSNPTSQAEATSNEVYTYSKAMLSTAQEQECRQLPWQDTHITQDRLITSTFFPAMSFAAIHCHAKEITDGLFLVAAQAVANSLNEDDLAKDRVIPHIDRIRDVARNVATSVILACQENGLAQKHVGKDWNEVYSSVSEAMYSPTA